MTDTDRTPTTQAGRALLDYGRVAALVEAISRLPSSGGINYGDGVPPEHNLIERSAVLALLSDLATAAAERDERVRREGWDAALAEVRRYYFTKPGGRLMELLDRLASEGPR